VKICSIEGGGFYYIPGTDICANTTTGETRQETIGGTWYGHLPSAGTWVKKPKAACKDGKLVEVGTFTSSDLVLNSHEKYQTGPVTLNLGTNDFIATVIMSGGFDVPDKKGTFCLAFYDATSGDYAVLGCEDTKPLLEQPALFAFTPLTSIPPASFTPPFKLIGYNANETWETGTFDGALSYWVCVQHAP
jgi:hypothetical protein